MRLHLSAVFTHKYYLFLHNTYDNKVITFEQTLCSASEKQTLSIERKKESEKAASSEFERNPLWLDEHPLPRFRMQAMLP